MNFVEMKEQARREWENLQHGGKPLIYIGTATCGRSAGSLEVVQTFQEELKNRGIDAIVVEVGCMGPCHAEPLVNIAKPGHPTVCYGNVTSEKVGKLIEISSNGLRANIESLNKIFGADISLSFD